MGEFFWNRDDISDKNVLRGVENLDRKLAQMQDEISGIQAGILAMLQTREHNAALYPREDFTADEWAESQAYGSKLIDTNEFVGMIAHDLEKVRARIAAGRRGG